MKRGAHRCFVAVRTEEGTHEVALTLAKGARSRVLEDAVVSRVALITLARASGLELSTQQGDLWRMRPDEAGDVHDRHVDRETLEVTFTARD